MYDLPEVVKIEEKDVEAPSGTLKKKQKTGEHQSKGNRVLNTDPNPEYKMLKGEDFKKVYYGKNAQYRPFWDKAKETKICPHYHSRWYCFDNCDMIDNHVGKDKVPASVDTEYKKFLKKVKKLDYPGRGLAASGPTGILLLGRNFQTNAQDMRCLIRYQKTTP